MIFNDMFEHAVPLLILKGQKEKKEKCILSQSVQHFLPKTEEFQLNKHAHSLQHHCEKMMTTHDTQYLSFQIWSCHMLKLINSWKVKHLSSNNFYSNTDYRSILVFSSGLSSHYRRHCNDMFLIKLWFYDSFMILILHTFAVWKSVMGIARCYITRWYALELILVFNRAILLSVITFQISLIAILLLSFSYYKNVILTSQNGN